MLCRGWGRVQSAPYSSIHALGDFIFRKALVVACFRHGKSAMTSKKPKPEGLFPTGFWDRPISQKLGDPNPIGLYAAVGHALSEWEMTEERLSALCVIFSEANAAGAVAVAMRQVYGSIESSVGRRTALTKLHEVYFHPYPDTPEIKTPFTQLMEGFSSAARLRDDLAHGLVTRIETVASSDGPRKYGCFLCPADYNTGRNYPYMKWDSDDDDVLKIMPGKYRYTANDVINIVQQFNLLRDKIVEYIDTIGKFNGIPNIILEMKSRTTPPKDE